MRSSSSQGTDGGRGADMTAGDTVVLAAAGTQPEIEARRPEAFHPRFQQAG
jgi:hypothetical protein